MKRSRRLNWIQCSRVISRVRELNSEYDREYFILRKQDPNHLAYDAMLISTELTTFQREQIYSFSETKEPRKSFHTVDKYCLQNFGNYLPIEIASYSGRLES